MVLAPPAGLPRRQYMLARSADAEGQRAKTRRAAVWESPYDGHARQ